MKRSARFMTLGIGIILAGILGILFSILLSMEPPGSNGAFLLWYIAQGLPIFASVVGPILLIVGFFIKDEK